VGRFRILGSGWYGCHLGAALLERGHDVEIHESGPHVFCGASGKIPARLHGGAHYPRSHKTRAACQRHTAEFMAKYGFLTRGVPVNLYAIAEHESYVDFDQYTATLRGEFDFIPVFDTNEFGLRNVEGAILTGERHILANAARAHFEKLLDGHVALLFKPDEASETEFDFTIDCTFCANGDAGVDRYEPCLVLLLEGPTDRAVTIMDGPFPSLYPWDPERRLSSLSSALFTPFSKTIRTYAEARAMLDNLPADEIRSRTMAMLDSMLHFYPGITEYTFADFMLSIRAMPKSGADTRLVDVVQAGPRLLRVRAGKIDAVLDAERQVMELIACA
jgi:hypothetical protein